MSSASVHLLASSACTIVALSRRSVLVLGQGELAGIDPGEVQGHLCVPVSRVQPASWHTKV